LDHPDINRMWARRLTGFADPVPDDARSHGHELLGRRVTHLVLDDDPGALHAMMADGRFVLVDLRGDLGQAPDEDWSGPRSPVRVHLGPVTTGHPTWHDVAAVLMRPDGRV